MTAKECIYGRRSIRKYKPDPVDHALLESVIEAASYAPSWKHSQTIRYIAIEGELKDKIGRDCTTIFPNNGKIIENAPLLIAVPLSKTDVAPKETGPSLQSVEIPGRCMMRGGPARPCV